MTNIYSSDTKTDERDTFGMIPLPESLDLEAASSHRSLTPFSRILQVCLGVAGLAWLALLASNVVLAATSEASDSWPVASARSQNLESVSLAVSALVLGSLVVWSARAYRNLDAANLASESPTQVLISWFVPVLNLLVPARALEELYLTSQRAATSDRDRSRSFLVWFWWLGGPIMFIVRLALFQLRPMLFPGGRLATIFDIATNAANATIGIACVAGIVIVNRVSNASNF